MARASATSADDWALCVGIGDYVDQVHLGKLPGARADAERFLHWLVSDAGGGVPQDHCTLIQSPILQSEIDPQPVAQVVEAWFKMLFKRTVVAETEGRGSRIGRRLYLYFSGHGLSLGATSESVLLTADAEPPAACEHVAARLWAEWFQMRGAFDEVMLVMDCCRSVLHSVHVNGPPWQVRKAGTPARYFYTFAVANGAAAREVEVDGKPVGLFTHKLLELLEDVRRRPLSASALKGLLYGAFDKANAPLIGMPADPRDDFVVASVPARVQPPDGGSCGAPDTVMVVYGDGPGEDAPRVASAVRLTGGIALALSALGSSGDRGVRSLVIESERISDAEIARVVGLVKPQRAVLYRRYRTSSSEHVRHVRASATDSPALARVRVLAALDGVAIATLRVRAADPWTRILVWSVDGELLAEGSDLVALEDVPRATYRVRARIGAASWTTDHALDRDATIEVPLLPLETAAPVAGSTRWTKGDRAALASSERSSAVAVIHRGLGPAPLRGRDPEDRDIPAPTAPAGSWMVSRFDTMADRLVLEVMLGGRFVALSLPVRPGYRTEVYVDGNPDIGALPRGDAPEYPDLAIRVVPSGIAIGEPQPTDRVRECLRLALVHDGPEPLPVSLVEVGEDPIAALLASASSNLPPGAVRALVDRAAIVLGDADGDVIAGRGGDGIACPPLLAFSWRRITANGGDVLDASLADRVSGQQVALWPWLAWDSDLAAGSRSWLRSVAAVMWPAWDSDPDPAESCVPLEAVGRQLGVPGGSAFRRTKKSPPVERLVRHDEVAFVGASNDQLAAAIAIAFIERTKRRWRELTLWFLGDARLDRMVSAQRSGASLRRARDRAEGELIRMLPVVAEAWRVLRYEGFDIRDAWHFASLWDWRKPGGFVHVSPYGAGQDVRTTEKLDMTWSEAAAAPSEAYAATARAYEALAPTAVIATSPRTR